MGLTNAMKSLWNKASANNRMNSDFTRLEALLVNGPSDPNPIASQVDAVKIVDDGEQLWDKIKQANIDVEEAKNNLDATVVQVQSAVNQWRGLPKVSEEAQAKKLSKLAQDLIKELEAARFKLVKEKAVLFALRRKNEEDMPPLERVPARKQIAVAHVKPRRMSSNGAHPKIVMIRQTEALHKYDKQGEHGCRLPPKKADGDASFRYLACVARAFNRESSEPIPVPEKVKYDHEKYQVFAMWAATYSKMK